MEPHGFIRGSMSAIDCKYVTRYIRDMCKIVSYNPVKFEKCGCAFVVRVSNDEQAVLDAVYGPGVDKSKPWSYADLVHLAIMRAVELEMSK